MRLLCQVAARLKRIRGGKGGERRGCERANAVAKIRTHARQMQGYAASQQVPLSSNTPGTCKPPWRTSRPGPWQPCAPTAQ